MRRFLILNEWFSFLFRLSALILMTILGEWSLHHWQLDRVGRHLGLPGVLLLLVSMRYVLQKRRQRSITPSRRLLEFHQWTVLTGGAMIFIHAGLHFNAILPWLATLALAIVLLSGLVGHLLLKRSMPPMVDGPEKNRDNAIEENNDRRFADAITSERMVNWRSFHLSVSLIFAVLALGHVLTILMFWGW